MKKHDVIVIGSGLGGLMCAFLLSKFGYDVLVLEKNNQIGGCLQTFRRKGITFDTGMHYIGSLKDGQIMNTFFKYFNLNDNVKLQELNPSAYDTISTNGMDFDFPVGYENLKENLLNSFGSEKKAIDTYIKDIKQIANSSPFVNLKKLDGYEFTNNPYNNISVSDYISKITSNPDLQNVLAGNLFLYGGEKNITPLYIHAQIRNFYTQGAYRIVGGSDSIAKSLESSILKNGGKILTDCEVTEIKCDSSKAEYVVTKGNEKFYANHFISDIHPQTLLKLTDTPLLRKAYRNRINKINNTVSNFGIYIKFKNDAKLAYKNTNFYRFACENVWDYIPDDNFTTPKNYLLMHQAESVNQEYAKSAVILTPMKFESVKKWENSFTGKRDKSYYNFKQECAEKVFSLVRKFDKEIINAIDYYETSSPLTYRDYTYTAMGSTYGIMHNANNIAESYIPHKTKIPNLLLTGQNINTHGMLGVTIGSIITCSSLIDYNTLIKDITNSTNHTNEI